jgi:hypothetical protein
MTLPEPVSDAASISGPAARVAIAAAGTTLLLLASLHVLSPEFEPSWRVISEYAFGQYGWVLSLMFAAWGISTWALARAIWSHVATKAGKVGLWLLVAAGLGEALASVFDVTHEVGHGIAGLLGVLGLPVGALLVSAALARSGAWSATNAGVRRWLAHLTWVSLVLLVVTLGLMTAQVAHANGGKLPTHAPKALPAGVIGLDGWADRLIVLSSCVWVIVVAWQAITVHRRPSA